MNFILFFLLLLPSIQSLKQEDYQKNRTFLSDNQNILYEQGYDNNNPNDQSYSIFYYHKWSNFVAWAILADFGIIIIRYGLLNRYRYILHSILMFLCILPTLIAEIMMLVSNAQTPPFLGDKKLDNLHCVIGDIYIGLMVFQCLSGITLKLFIDSYHSQKYRKLLQLTHLYFGHTIYFIGKIECGFAFYLLYINEIGDGRYNLIGFWITYSLIFFWRILIEIFYQNNLLYKILYKKKDIQENRQHSLSESLLTQYIIQNQTQQINDEFANRMWFIFNGQIIDLSKFIHPGGQQIWIKLRGREVSRFIYGGGGLEDGTITSYRHSQNAIQLIQNNVVGLLDNVTYPFDQQINIKQCENWELQTISQITDNVCYFGFINKNIEINSQFKQINAFGKYYQLSSLENKKISIRQYTCINSLAPQNCYYRKNLIQYIDNNDYDKQPPQQLQNIDELPIIIKKYSSKNGFSQFIHQSQTKKYKIEGPFGTMHEFPNKGKVVIICGGTGIFPFMDLLDFMLKTIIYLILQKQKGQNITNQFNIMDLQFNTNIHITMFFSVANQNELIGLDIYSTILRLQKQLDQEYFKLFIRSPKDIEGAIKINQRFSKDILLTNLINVQEYNKYFICGPPQMQKDVPIALTELGVQKQNIIFI